MQRSPAGTVGAHPAAAARAGYPPAVANLDKRPPRSDLSRPSRSATLGPSLDSAQDDQPRRPKPPALDLSLPPRPTASSSTTTTARGSVDSPIRRKPLPAGAASNLRNRQRSATQTFPSHGVRDQVDAAQLSLDSPPVSPKNRSLSLHSSPAGINSFNFPRDLDQ